MPFKTSKIKQKHSWQFDAIGTKWSIETVEPLLGTVKHEIEKHIEFFDKTYSRFRNDSMVSQIAAAPGEFTLPSNAAQLSGLYKKLYDATNGAVSPFVGASLNSAGYDKSYSLQATGPTPAPQWDDTIEWRGSSIATRQPITLDVGAAGKGLLVDEIAKIIERYGIDNYIVDGSGDVRCRGDMQRVGLENPFNPNEVIGVAEVQDASLCASAINRRKWGDGWHHILDARTGLPVNDVLAVWVIAEPTYIADGLATALFFVAANELYDIADFHYVRLLSNGTVEHSEHFVGELYI